MGKLFDILLALYVVDMHLLRFQQGQNSFSILITCIVSPVAGTYGVFAGGSQQCVACLTGMDTSGIVTARNSLVCLIHLRFCCMILAREVVFILFEFLSTSYLWDWCYSPIYPD